MTPKPQVGMCEVTTRVSLQVKRGRTSDEVGKEIRSDRRSGYCKQFKNSSSDKFETPYNLAVLVLSGDPADGKKQCGLVGNARTLARKAPLMNRFLVQALPARSEGWLRQRRLRAPPTSSSSSSAQHWIHRPIQFPRSLQRAETQRNQREKDQMASPYPC